MHKATDIKERMYDLTEKERFNNIIIEFSYFAKKVIPQLKVLKKGIQTVQQIKTSSIANHKGLYNILTNYENLNLNVYVEQNKQKMVFAHETLSNDYRESMDLLISKQNNPFVDMYHWCKGEIYDL